MSKKLYLLLAVALVAVLAFGIIGSGAWFTDTASIENNSVSTGELDLSVWGGPFTATKLEPGGDYVKLGVFCAKNEGDYDMKWRGWMTDVSDPANLRSKLLVRGVINPTGNVGNYGPENYELFTDIPFTQLTSANSIIAITNSADPLYPGYYACYEIQAKLDGSAPNSMQNATLEAKFFIEATQRLNPGYAQ